MSGFDLQRVASALQPGEISWSLQYEPACDSTQDVARSAAVGGEAQGWTIVTDLQRQGRGRAGRSWVAPAGEALLFSTILRPPIDVLALLPLLAGLAVAGGIEVATGVSPDLKWPNDLLIKGQKLAGILLEHPPGSGVILGAGVNVNQQRPDLPETATSLAIEVGHAIEREPLLAAILNDLGNVYERADREGIQWIVPGWRSRSSMFGQPVSFVRDGTTVEALAEDLAPDGSLIVRTHGGTRLELIAGEVERVRLS